MVINNIRRGGVDYSQITDNAYKIALNYLTDEDSAREIAQLTAIEAFLNADNLKPETLHNWVFTVAKNKALNYIRSSKITVEVEPAYFDNIKDVQFNETQEESLSQILDDIPTAVVSIKDRRIFLHSLRRGETNAVRDLNENPESFRKKIYRIKKEIMLYHKICSGVKCLDPIPGTKLHTNLLNFIVKMKSGIENNDFGLFDEFEIDDKSRKRLLKTAIAKIVKYQIDILRRNVYEVYVFYFDKQSMIDSLKFQIIVHESGRMQLMSFPRMPRKIVKIDNKNIPADLKEKLQPGRDGTLPLSLAELDQAISEKVKEFEVIYDLEE